MRKEPVKGTSDYLPREAALRDEMQSTILSTYQANGFVRIVTPALEDIGNLDKSDGGENLALIFKILKRGQKLAAALACSGGDDLADMGLRYDLTLPLCRYYANNRQELLLPFKCIQMDRVYRAEQPQRGRSRELMQCDIDIIGSDSIHSEIELIHVTAQALGNLGLKNFRVKLNDRRVLLAVLRALGFEPEALSGVCVALDKLDKVGAQGVSAELLGKGYPAETVEAFAAFLKEFPVTLEEVKARFGQCDAIDALETILQTVKALAQGCYEVAFDLSLVRGQGYYTGTVFEIESDDFSGSIAGGGRYDNLIEKFTGQAVPAVGFSIGFERIYSILTETGRQVLSARKKLAVLYEGDFLQANAVAERYRPGYDVALFVRPKKLGKFIAALQAYGYDGLFVCGKSQDVEWFIGN